LAGQVLLSYFPKPSGFFPQLGANDAMSDLGGVCSQLGANDVMSDLSGMELK
jgi:hypothetical protein